MTLLLTAPSTMGPMPIPAWLQAFVPVQTVTRREWADVLARLAALEQRPTPPVPTP